MSNVKELTSFWSLNLFENIIQFRIRKSNNQFFAYSMLILKQLYTAKRKNV